MKLSEDLTWRGLIKDRTFEDTGWLDTPKTFYLGVDCSTDSMTIGNLAVFLLARRLLEAGWQAVLLVGGATSLIGDPGGKEEERQLKSHEEIESNVKAIKKQVELLFAGKNFTPANNYDWFKEQNYLEFLRDVGKHFSMTELLQREFIVERIGEGGSGISYAEFSYSLIQGFDFLQLNQRHAVELQIGGSDQWGNMLSGVLLIRKKSGAEVHAMSIPLIVNKSTGKKFGKSEDGAVWLDPNKTSIYNFYQFWINTDDGSVEDFLKIFTLNDKDSVERIMDEQRQSPGLRPAQKALAYEVTKHVHGQLEADRIQKVSESLFGGLDAGQLDKDAWEVISNELPVLETHPGEQLFELLVKGKLAASNTEARRFLTENAVYINNLQFSSEKSTVDEADFVNGYALLRRGKNQQVVLKKA